MSPVPASTWAGVPVQNCDFVSPGHPYQVYEGEVEGSVTMLQHSKYRGGEERALSTFISPTRRRSKAIRVGLICIIADGMSNHFTHVNVSLGMLKRVQCAMLCIPFPLQISALGLESSVLPITSSHPAQKNRFVYLNEHGLVLLPNGPSWVFRARAPFSKPLLGVGLAEPFKNAADWSQGRDESVKDFVTRRFNAEVCTSGSVCVHACVCACVRACVRVCVCVHSLH